MNKLTTLRKRNSKISWKYLLFILFIVIGYSYQVVQVIQVYLQFETKIDVKFNDENEISVPMLSLCKPTSRLMRNYSLINFKRFFGLSPAKIYNMTFSFKEIVIDLAYSDGRSISSVKEFKDEEHQIKSIIHYEKTINVYVSCYNFKYSNAKKIINKKKVAYDIKLYHYGAIETPYYLHLSSNMDNNVYKGNYLEIFGN